jgi:hypothetical protein
VGLKGGISASEASKVGSCRLLSCTTSDGQHDKTPRISEGKGDTCLVLLRVKVIISDDGDVDASTKGLF